jgi:hypothetical protein
MVSVHPVDDGKVVSFASVHVPQVQRRTASPSGASAQFSDPVVQLFPLEPGTFDLAVYRGDTYEWVFQLMALDRYPIDITGWVVKAEIRTGVDGPLMASLQEMARIPGEGKVRMRLPADQSKFVTSAGVWDLQVTTVDGWVKTVLRGAVRYLGDVTTGVVPYGLGTR